MEKTPEELTAAEATPRLSLVFAKYLSWLALVVAAVFYSYLFIFTPTNFWPIFAIATFWLLMSLSMLIGSYRMLRKS
jgi:membrane protein YdbS with pleckstrin-like domain